MCACYRPCSTRLMLQLPSHPYLFPTLPQAKGVSPTVTTWIIAIMAVPSLIVPFLSSPIAIRGARFINGPSSPGELIRRSSYYL